MPMQPVETRGAKAGFAQTFFGAQSAGSAESISMIELSYASSKSYPAHAGAPAVTDRAMRLDVNSKGTPSGCASFGAMTAIVATPGPASGEGPLQFAVAATLYAPDPATSETAAMIPRMRRCFCR